MDDAVASARHINVPAGVDGQSIGLIFAIPGQTQAKWEKTLSWALALDPDWPAPRQALQALQADPRTPG